ALGDVDGDGKLDLVFCQPSGVSELLGNGDGTFRAGPAYSLPSRPRFAIIEDVNADGRPDLVLANAVNDFQMLGDLTYIGTVSILLGNAGAAFRAPLTYEAGDAAFSVVAGD